MFKDVSERPLNIDNYPDDCQCFPYFKGTVKEA